MKKIFINKKVRLSDEQIKWHLDWSHESFEYPSETYDNMVQAFLLMAIFSDSHPGVVMGQSPLTKCYRVVIHPGYSAFFNREDLILKD